MNGVKLTQQQDAAIFGKPYWVSSSDVQDRFVKNDYMLYIDLGIRRYLNDKVYLDILGYASLGLRDLNAEGWKMQKKPNRIFTTSHNAFAGVKLCVGLRFAPSGIFVLSNSKFRR